MGCCPVVLPSVVSTPLSTPSTPPPVSWTPTSLEPSTTELPVMSRSCCRTTSPSRISLLASTTTCPRVPSTWPATLTRLLPRVRGSQLRLLPPKKLPHLGPSLP